MGERFLRCFGKRAMAALLLFAVITPATAWASHFRGGSITWQSKAMDVDGIRNDVEITVKTAWRFNNIGGVSLVRSPNFAFTGGANNTILYINGDATAADYALQTTIYTAKNLDLNTEYNVYFGGSARIAGLVNNANGSWKIQTQIFLKDDNLAPKIDLPIIFEIPKLQADGVTPLSDWTYKLKSTDPNADKLRYRLANLDELGGGSSTNASGLAINPNTGLITWSGSGLKADGLYSAGIIAEDLDENGNVKSKTHVDLILSLVNKAQVNYTNSGTIPETRNVVVEKGSSFSFTISGTAIDTQSLGNLQGTLVETSPENYTFTPGPSGSGLDPGSYPITFEVRDGTNVRSNNYLGLTFIVPDPNAPRITNIEADRVNYSNTAPVIVDQNNDAVVTDADTTDFNGGMLKANVTFSDGQLEIIDVLSSGVGAGQISRVGNAILYEGTAFGTINPILNGEGKALEIAFTGPTTLAALQALVRAITYEDTFPLRDAGDRNLSLYVKDPEGRSSSYDLFVNVATHPDAGNYSNTPLQAANEITLVEGDALVLSDEYISYADPENDAITFTASNVTNGRFALVSDLATPITQFTQQQISLGQIAFVHDGSELAPTYELSASDGVNTTPPTAGVVIFTNVSTNTPSISNSPSTSATEGVPYSFTPSVTDADLNDTKTFSITNKPSWASFDTTTGALTGTPGGNSAGVYSNVTIKVTDSGGLNSSVVASITVSAATDTDGDGSPDYVEVAGGTDPNDGTNFPDADNDGVPDYVETYINSTDPTDPASFTDTDTDGVPDYVETAEGTNPNDVTDFTDTDNDGISNYVDTDNDNDGIADSVEGTGDADLDLLPNYLDSDSDGDGMTDLLEGVSDADGDTISNFLDADSDNDSIPDGTEGTLDRDGDTVPNYLDSDSDNDTITDAVEGLTDSDGDGTPNYVDSDSDNDGIPDSIEAAAGSNPLDPLSRPVDSDKDGLPDALDNNDVNWDTDGDGIPDGADADIDGDGTPDNGSDSDSDGIRDAVDTSNTVGVDADGDGIVDTADAINNTLDTDHDGLPDVLDPDDANFDTDGDGIPDGADVDIDGDGVDDNGTDTDQDGINNRLDVNVRGGADVDGDGIADVADPINDAADADQDGLPDVVDPNDNLADIDSDGIPDGADVDVDGNGVRDNGIDSDADGINNLTEGNGDSDGDGLANKNDTDSDNDGVTDGIEGVGDKDHDGNADYIDSSSDEDRDGIPDLLEGTTDSDNDGLSDYRDNDSDNDGIPDRLEAPNGRLPTGVDTDKDGIDDALDVNTTGGNDSNSNGIDDAFEPIDSDLDGIPDYRDVDSDKDGVPDRLEADMIPLSGVDSDDDGIDDLLDVNQTSGADLNGDGIDDAFAPKDSDGDGVPNNQEQDSDGDGVLDGPEAGAGVTDADSDGIVDTFDADLTGGSDSNHDGIDDAAGLRDSDADGVADLADLDSDNDSVLDVIEAGLTDANRDGLSDNGATTSTPIDSDNDGTRDMLDLDSDNDGVPDIVKAGNGVLDQNSDGRIDNIADVDDDGIADVADEEIGHFGGSLDTDADAIPNSLDKDDDNDGIADVLENTTIPTLTGVDLDGDGIDDATDVSYTGGSDKNVDGVDDRYDGDTDDDGVRDSLDVDSDNDGVADIIEAFGLGKDVNTDGRIDGFVDSNLDGLDDTLANTLSLVDSDKDGMPDLRDVDSDNDGIWDLLESGSAASLDVNKDGHIDTFVDSDKDGLADSVDGKLAADKPAGTPPSIRDTDKDGIVDFLDVDSDNDGFSDADENGDFNNDGVPDNAQNGGKLETAVRGGGSIDLIILAFLLAVAALHSTSILRSRAIRKAIAGLTLMLPLAHKSQADKPSCSDAQQFNSCWYVGAGGAFSRLEPEGEVNGWSTNDTSNHGVQINIGQRFAPKWFWELKYLDAGQAGLGNRNPALEAVVNDAAIEYRIPSLMIGYSVWSSETGSSIFVKAGVSAIETKANDARIGEDAQTSSQLALGVGYQFDFAESAWFMKVELDSYDRDANVFGIGLSRYF